MENKKNCKDRTIKSVIDKKIHKYLLEYLKFGFIPATHDERLPLCLLCKQCLTNESMKRGRLEAHFLAKHSSYKTSDLSFFQSLKKQFEQRTTLPSLFTLHSSISDRTL